MTDSHRNDERTVRCPVDGCDATPLARGINLHLRQSSGDGHGPQGDVPDHISTDDLETVGSESVTMDYPEERDTENVARLCPYCSQPCKGTNGVLIHLGQMAGRENHPEDAADHHSEEDFPVVEVDEYGNVTSVGDESVDARAVDLDTGAVPVQQVYQFIAELLADNKRTMAKRVRHRLLGDDYATRPIRGFIPHRELYEALTKQRLADEPADRITARIEAEGIRVACRGESALMGADVALDIAAALERGAADEGEIADLIEFLRYGGAVLRGEQQGSLPIQFADWR